MQEIETDQNDGVNVKKESVFHGSADFESSVSLIKALQNLHLWTHPEDYELLSPFHNLRDQIQSFHKTRQFILLLGQVYQSRELGKLFPFEFREAFDEQILHVVDFMKALMVSFGEICFTGRDLGMALRYDKDEYSHTWWKKYWDLMKPFYSRYVDSSEYVAWSYVPRNVKVLDIIELYLHEHCQPGLKKGLEISPKK